MFKRMHTYTHTHTQTHTQTLSHKHALPPPQDPSGYAVYTCSHPTTKITNGDTNDGTFIKYDAASRTVWLEIRLPSPTPLGWLLVKGFFNGATLLMVGEDGGVVEVTSDLRKDPTFKPYQVSE